MTVTGVPYASDAGPNTGADDPGEADFGPCATFIMAGESRSIASLVGNKPDAQLSPRRGTTELDP
jgi:hypothetical protein